MNQIINPQKQPRLTVAMSHKHMLLYLFRYNATSTDIKITEPAY